MIRLVAGTMVALGVIAGPVTRSADLVTVEEESGVYRVRADFEVPQAAGIVRSVLTDYEQIPRFMPDVKASVVIERAPRLLVRQEAVSRFAMFSQSVVLLLEITEDANGLRFIDRDGGSFTQYEGAWRFEPGDERTLITYELTAKPSFSVPEFMLKRLMKRNAGEMIARIKREIAIVRPRAENRAPREFSARALRK